MDKKSIVSESNNYQVGERLIDEMDAFHVESEILLTTAAVAQQISDTVEVEPGPKRWMVSIAVLSFFLHYMNRRTFATKGADFRAAMQDTVCISSIEKLFDASWNTSNVTPGFDKESFKRQVVADAVDVVNDNELGFANHREMFTENLISRDTVLGQYAAGLMSTIGESDTHPLKLVVATTTLAALTQSNISKNIDSTRLFS